jgi:hypothetical protein
MAAPCEEDVVSTIRKGETVCGGKILDFRSFRRYPCRRFKRNIFVFLMRRPNCGFSLEYNLQADCI